jgi:hypothetical protein
MEKETYDNTMSNTSVTSSHVWQVATTETTNQGTITNAVGPPQVQVSLEDLQYKLTFSDDGNDPILKGERNRSQDRMLDDPKTSRRIEYYKSLSEKPF